MINYILQLRIFSWFLALARFKVSLRFVKLMWIDVTDYL